MLLINPKSPVPPFEQLRLQLIEQVRSGELAAGTRLPTVRRLAEDLGIAPNTVARTYRELEADGFVETRGRNGTLVSPQGDPSELQGQLAARTYVERVRALGIDPEVALGWVTKALAGG